MDLSNIDFLLNNLVLIKSFYEFYSTHCFPNLMILSGPNKTLKKIFIFRLIKYHLCLNPNHFEPCNQCKSCILLDTNEHPDLIVFPEDTIKIGDAKEPEIYTIRWLQKEKLIFRPMVSPFRFVIFLSSELLENESEVALLKTLEEPKNNTKFVFFTTSLEFLRETVVSRGVVIPFSYFSYAQMKKILSNKEEDFIEILGGNIDNYQESYYELFKELQLKINLALQHPMELLNLEKWSINFSLNNKSVEENTFWELFCMVLLQKLKQKKLYILMDFIFDFLIKLRTDQHGIIPYLVSNLFFQLHYHLYFKS